MLELLIAAGVGLPATATATGFTVAKYKRKKAQRLLSRMQETAKQFSAELLTNEFQFRTVLYSVNFHWYTTDAVRLKFPIKVSYKRGTSEAAKQKYESIYGETTSIKSFIEEFIGEEIRACLARFMKVATANELVFHESNFEKEIARFLAVKMAERGLVLTDFTISIKGYDEDILLDVEAGQKIAFESILNRIPVKENLREYLSDVNQNYDTFANLQNGQNTADANSTSLSFKSLSTRLNKLEESWMEYELNPNLLLNYPLMSDASCEETANFFVRIGQAQALYESAQEDESVLGEFAAALEVAELAFVKAESNAKKVRHAYLTSEQRKAVEKSRPLVAMYRDEEASPQERINAFKKANRNLEGIMMLPERPIMGLLEAAQ